LFRRAGPVLLRAAPAGVHEVPQDWPDPEEGSLGELRDWVCAVWRGPIAAAVADASPSLAAAIDRLCAGEALAERKVRRAATSLVGYLLRAAGRSTPFSLFAGTAPGGFAPRGHVRWGVDHRVVMRVDEAEVHAAVDTLEAEPEVVERLWVVTDNRCRRRGRSFVLAIGGQCSELGATGPVEAVLTAAAGPVRVAEVVAWVQEGFPQAPHARVVELVCGLLAHGFLRSSLRPHGTVPEPQVHVASELARCGVAGIPAAAEAAARLPATATATLQSANQHTSFDTVGPASTLRRELRVDCDIALPETLGEEVETGASTLLRLSPHPRGHPVWRQYYEEFVHRYGAGALVPLLDVVDADMGLGYPATYPGSLIPQRPQEPPERQARLLRLAQQAAASGTQEVMFDRAEIEGLVVAEPVRLPPHVEVGVRVAAPSKPAVEAGDFTIRLRPARAVGTLTGRFTPADSALAEVYRHLPPTTHGALRAQLVFPALRPSAAHLARTPRFLEHLICVGGYPPEDAEVLALEDLAVLADRHQLHLVHVPTRRVVEPEVLHALSLDHQAPPLARFLAHLPRGCLATFTRFDWGAAAELPFLPRLRHGRTVLAPGRWRLETGDLPPRSAAPKEWRAALERWCAAWRVPAQVELAQSDRVLPLRLDEPAPAAVLRRRRHTAGHVFLTETDDPGGLGWIGGHAHDIAVPQRTPAPRPPPPCLF
jgi:lantibiotic biosynthesis protein